jgi:hypothetical protein
MCSRANWTACLLVALMSLAAAIVSADGIFDDGFEFELAYFGPPQNSLALGSSSTAGVPLSVRLTRAADVDVFVPIASDDPERLAVVDGGVTIPAGSVSAPVALEGLQAGAEYVGLHAFFFRPRSASVRVEWIANDSGEALEADYCVIQFPSTISVSSGALSPLVFGRLYEAGLTGQGTFPADGVLAEVGYAVAGTPPLPLVGWHFVEAVPNLAVGNDHEYMAQFVAPAEAGEYDFLVRFSIDGGGTWTLCDLEGAGSNDGLEFNPDALGAMTVTENGDLAR